MEISLRCFCLPFHTARHKTPPSKEEQNQAQFKFNAQSTNLLLGSMQSVQTLPMELWPGWLYHWTTMRRKLGKVRLPANALWVTSHWVAAFSQSCGFHMSSTWHPKYDTSFLTNLLAQAKALTRHTPSKHRQFSSWMRRYWHGDPICYHASWLPWGKQLYSTVCFHYGALLVPGLKSQSQRASLFLLCSLSRGFGSSNEKPKTRVVIAISLGTIRLIFGAPIPWYIPIGKAQGLGFSHHH